MDTNTNLHLQADSKTVELRKEYSRGYQVAWEALDKEYKISVRVMSLRDLSYNMLITANNAYFQKSLRGVKTYFITCDHN